MRSRYLAASIWLASLAAPLSAQSVKAGIDAWQKADYAAAVAIWRPLAEQGDADAQFNLGQAYRLGRGVPIDLGAAQLCFERAAARGHLDAQTTLGLLLFQNGNHTGAVRWLKAASDKDEPRAMLVYGTALFNGDGVPQDPVQGYAYITRAAARGLPAAKDTLDQLNRILPLQERTKGRALAILMAKDRGDFAAKPADKPLPKPAAKPAKTAAAPPVAKPAPQPERSVALTVRQITKGWRVQLGAFSNRSSAEALYRRLASNAALRDKAAFYGAVGNITRLQVGPFASRGAAQAACNALKGQPCFPVPGPNR